jgi:hypothetical protein
VSRDISRSLLRDINSHIKQRKSEKFIILLKRQSKCNMVPTCSLSRDRNSHINQIKSERKKEKFRPSILHKKFWMT